MPNKISEFFTGLNWAIKPLMASPFRGVLSSYVVLMKFTGRKSGQVFITPVGYNKFDNSFLIALSDTKNRKWWLNYREPWPMELQYKGSWVRGTAVVLPAGSEDYKKGFEAIFNRRSFMPHILKIHDYKAEQGLTEAQLAIMLSEGNGLVRFDAITLKQ